MHDELTRIDIQKMEAELEEHRREWPDLIAEVQRTRAFGDLSENYEYKAAKQAQNQCRRRMRYLENMIKTARVIDDRFEDYDDLEEKLFSLCAQQGMGALSQVWEGHIYPSRAYEEGGIHEAIADYEDAVFYQILAEELARRDLGLEDSDPEDFTELTERMEDYLDEFEKNGLDDISIELE